MNQHDELYNDFLNGYFAVDDLHLDGLLEVLLIHQGNIAARVSLNEFFQNIFVEHLTLQALKLLDKKLHDVGETKL